MKITWVTERSAISENSVSSGALWRAKLPPLSEKKSSKRSPKNSSNWRCWSEKKHMVVEFFNASWRVLMGNTIGKVYYIVWCFQNWAKLLTFTKKIVKKNRQIGGADQKKHMVVEFFNTSWIIMMGNTIRKAYYIAWYFQNWAKLPKLTKKNRQEKIVKLALTALTADFVGKR